jgi:hypothetical protein
MRTGVISLIFAVFAVGCVSASADAKPIRDDDGPSLDRILPQIREHHPGTLYDAEGPFIGPDGRQHYRIKWGTPQGRVIWFNADARTGRVTNGDDFRRDRDFYDRPRNFDPDEDRPRGRGNRSHFDGDRGFDDPFDNGERTRGHQGRGWGDPGWEERGGRPNDRGDGFGRFDNPGGGHRGRGPNH